MRILIANRGEIARRVNRTALAMGHDTVAVFADPDADAPHVTEATMARNIGPAALTESYLSPQAILAAAEDTGATAIHPGYGFLSENAEFARAVIGAGMAWIGPKPEAIDRMGSKIEARKLADAAGVPIIPGFDESQDREELRAAAERIGYPVLIKASAGGGGKGIRIAHEVSEFDDALQAASTEAERSFGDGSVIVERFIQAPRHIEVQVVGDKHGRLVELGTRECSVQRRYQKVLEEAPAPNLPEQTRAGLRSSAVLLGQAIGYDSAGTVEFIVDDNTGEHFFLEMNTRLQVEHPVTEYVTGIDLVGVMIRVADGEPLPLPDEVVLRGHAIEARINAEDPANDFAPQTGTVHQLRVPDGVRWDAAIEAGGVISPFYDPMIAKLIVGAESRDAAMAKMRAALDELIIGGVTTNTGLQRWLLDTPEFVAGRITTRFLDAGAYRPSSDEGVGDATSIAAAAWVEAQQAASATSGASPWVGLPAFSVTPARSRRHIGLQPIGRQPVDGDSDGLHELQMDPTAAAVESADTTAGSSAVVDLASRRVSVNVGGQTFAFDVPPRSERWSADKAGRAGTGDAIVSPFPAVVAEIHVAPGDTVAGDQVLMTIEAMKMLHPMKASGAAVVEEVRVNVGDQVAANHVLITFAEQATPGDAQ